MRVVVDTSVAMAAGKGRPDAQPPSPACVAALDAIAASELRLAFNADLNAEWQGHARDYAMTWLKRMISTKRLDVVRQRWPDETRLLDAASDLPGKQPAQIAKDAHLVGLAMLTDRRVLSLDDRQRALLRAVLPAVPAIGALHWASPRQEQTASWLAAGAPEEPSLQLG